MIELNHFATICLFLAIAHTFSVRKFTKWALHYPEGSVAENLLHLLGEVEVVFGLWAGVFSAYYMFSEGPQARIAYLESLNFTEPTFVFVIMAICSTRPLLSLSLRLIHKASTVLPFSKGISFYLVTLILGPLLGSFITEPAAMTVTALILLQYFFKSGISLKFKYATLGLLFVNISIGGTLTHFAAPPVLMVANVWNWDLPFMFNNFGWKAMVACTVSTSLIAYYFQKELDAISIPTSPPKNIPFWVTGLHLLFLALVVATSHHLVAFLPLFLFFLGVTKVTQEFQDPIKLNDGLMVAFFLGGLVILGGFQRWWVEPIIMGLASFPLYLGATILTAFTDNAALTYLGAQLPNLAPASKYFLVSGAVVGGGLSVIANAPNPAGYGILNSQFGEGGISPLGLLAGALLPTLIAFGCFWFL